ncbi:sigma-70 family RNA polymerase sigma factor [Ktedonosporobacter rubrisoli]|uniref:RNA polymerase sigma factor n=1 Tax=Ktedonosporobacter rubrisoli TaxID=2509675 RepID=A0A4P6JZ19_KTERU|nr:sigma-70 family RNA polymerase sigma factor [Ktedonosporobacter rubrisoli]QBD80733.1 sigma-70 family RNA polymerase sigma factor [Ktedonosporobacter rubrisoli]
MQTWAVFEQELCERIEYVELLGELDFAPDWIEQFGNAVIKLSKQSGSARALRCLAERYPASLAAYMVARGIEGYQEGNYWSNIIPDVELSGANEQFLRKFFANFLDEHHLPAFVGLGGRKYVDVILLHGGIPTYSLTDFFTHILQPALLHPDLYGASAQEIIATWLETGSHTSVDKPIHRFLQFGGKLSVDFVARCLDMGYAYLEHQTLPRSAESGLPERVVTAYFHWVRQQATAQQSTKVRLSKPSIILDPWSENLFIELPAQAIPSTLSPEQGVWLIQADQQPETQVPFALNWRSDHWETKPELLELASPAAAYCITFSLPGFKRSWHFLGVTGEQPLLAFDPESNSLLQLHDSLPARLLWLLFPQASKLDIIGGQKRETFPPLAGAWEAYQAEAWDLSGATTVTIGAVSLAVEPDLAQLQPRLEGREVLNLLHLHDEPRIFIGAPPEIHIPLPPLRDPDIEARRWFLTIKKRVEGTQVQTWPVVELVNTIEQDTLKISLAASSLFPQEPSGLYEIALRGPLGRDTSFTIALVSALDIQIAAEHSLRLPDQSGHFPSPHLAITTSPELELESAGQENLQIEASRPGHYSVLVPAIYSQITLHICRQHGATQLRIPMTLPLPLLQWTVIDAPQNILKEEAWQSSVLSQPRAQLEQATAARLLVSISPGLNLTGLSSRLVVHYSQSEPPQIVSARGKFHKWLTFPLGEALDSIRSSREGHVLVELELSGLPERSKAVRLPVLRYTQSLELTNLNIESCLVDRTWLLLLSWHGERHLRNRHLRLWSLWHPWQPAASFPIADEAQDEYSFEIDLEALSPGPYRAEIALIDPWLASNGTRPALQAVGTTDIMLGIEQEPHSYLAQLPYTVEGILERFLAIPDTPIRLRLLDKLREHYQAQHTRMLFEALLVLLEQENNALPREIFTSFQHQLSKAPLRLLALAAGYSLQQDQQTRWHFEKLLDYLVPGTGLSHILNELHMYGSIDLAELVLLEPRLDRDVHIKAEIFSLLLEAGLRVRERNSEAQISDTQAMLDIDELYGWLPKLVLDSARQYLLEIGRYPLLRPERERHLARLQQQGKRADEQLEIGPEPDAYLARLSEQGKEAFRELTNCNLRLVVSIAKKYMNRGMEFLDIIQEGNIGLMRAVEKFDPALGYHFSTYATWWIRQAITRSFAEKKRLIRLPVHIHDEISRLKRARQELMYELSHEPTLSQLAERLDISPEKVQELQAFDQEHKSLDTPLGDDEENSFGDLIVNEEADPQESLNAIAMQELVEQLLSKLDRRERYILERRFGLGDETNLTLEQLGQEMQLTRERVRQIEERALKKLRASLGITVTKKVARRVSAKADA